MAEYIEREAAIEYARLLYCKDCNSYNGVRCRACAFDDVLLLIEDVPTADVVEVRHGEWDDCECSVCGEIHPTLYLDEWEMKYRIKETPYCPYCGAKMDGKGEGE